MPLNPDLQGRVFPATTPYLVGREKIREFARAVSATSPTNVDVDAARAAGHADLVAPPTFTVVIQERALAQLVAAPNTGLDPTRVVHATEKAVFSRPIVAGDELTAVLTVTSVTERAGNAILGIDSDIRDSSGGHVATITSTILTRGDDQ